VLHAKNKKRKNKMKKIMLALAVAMIAGMTQAAAFQWTLTGVKDNAGAAITASNTVSYELLAWTVNGEGGVGEAVTLGGTFKGTANSAVAMVNKTTGATDLTANTPYFVQLILKDGDWTYKTDVLKTANVPGTGNLSINFNNGNGFAESGAKVSFTGTNYGWTQTTDVPEPTSGLLLLLGVAGLALKRKRA
jgi:hypothetical protein